MIVMGISSSHDSKRPRIAGSMWERIACPNTFNSAQSLYLRDSSKWGCGFHVRLSLTPNNFAPDDKVRLVLHEHLKISYAKNSSSYAVNGAELNL